MLLVFYIDGLNIPCLYMLFILLGVFVSGIFVIGFIVTKELFPVQIAGTSTGIVNILPVKTYKPLFNEPQKYFACLVNLEPLLPPGAFYLFVRETEKMICNTKKF